MASKINLEKEIDRLYAQQYEGQQKLPKTSIDAIFNKITQLDKELQKLIHQLQQFYNPFWGEIMRAGAEPSRFAGQVEKYACIYMSKIGDFKGYSPRFYFRPRKRRMAHEF